MLCLCSVYVFCAVCMLCLGNVYIRVYDGVCSVYGYMLFDKIMSNKITFKIDMCFKTVLTVSLPPGRCVYHCVNDVVLMPC